MQKYGTNLKFDCFQCFKSKCLPVHDFDSYLGHLSDDRYTVNVFNLVHDDSGLGHQDGAFLMVNFLYPVGFLHGSHLRVPLDDLDPGLEFLRLQQYFYPCLDCMIRLAKLHPHGTHNTLTSIMSLHP